jgi:hypothetical protein
MLPSEAEQKLRISLRWFRNNLCKPYLDVPEAISWFKYSAVECRRQVTQLACQLRALGVVVETAETSTPGRIVYEDRLQIAAVPLY